MPFEGLREFLSLLEARTELARVSKEIYDNSYEISVILDKLQRMHGKAVIFENLKNYDIPMCANILGTLRRISMVLETNEEKLLDEWEKRKLSNWPIPKHVSDGPCKESVIKEEHVNLFRYPILKWNPLDAGRYITLGVLISNDPETGDRNAGIYRLMVQGKKQLGINMLETRHVTIHYKKAEALGKPLEAAVVIGLDPTIVLAAATDLKLGEDELAFAGALRKEPVKVTDCQTVDLEVPASSEIVIEGRIPPNIRAIEGPFGDYEGYYGAASYKPILRIEAITQRENPIYQATYTGKPPKEEHFITSTSTSPHHPSINNLNSLRNSISAIFRSAYHRLKLQMTAKPIKLPSEDIDKVANDWLDYGLE